MASRVSHTTVHCWDSYALQAFWAELLGYAPLLGDAHEPGDEQCLVQSPDGSHRLLFVETADPGPAGRVHLDLEPTDRTRDEEVERALGLGARLVDDRRRDDGRGWAVLADPEGNLFCVLRDRAARGADGSL